MTLPKIICFDLDATLWYPEMYMLSGPPFQLRTGKHGKPVIVDSGREELSLMGTAWSVLNELATDPKWEGTQVAYVSSTDRPSWAKQCLNMFKLECGLTMHELASHREIYVGSKCNHFKRIQERTGVAYKHMLLFDDMGHNIEDCSGIGVVCLYTPKGLTADAWQTGLNKYAARHKSTQLTA